MEIEQRVFLAYRAVFEGNNAQIRQPKAILKVVSKHRKSAQTLLQSLGEKQVLDTLKSLLERKVFQSELEAKLAFPNLFTTSLAQDVLHNASEADAARSQAEALKDMVSQEDEKDEALEATDEVPSVLNGAAAVPTQPITNRIKSPSLYPVYIPYKIQHLVLTRAQQLLEECCYNFSTQWLPELLEQRRWDCKEAIELNKWTHAATKRLDKLPSSCFTAFANDSALSLANVLVSANKLRHSAVHRLPTTAKGILEMVHSATRFARVLRDKTREQQFNELHRELEGKIRALALNKNFLETNLEQELQDIAKQRRELDKKEKEAIAVMLREDEDHGSLIGILLSDSVNHIFDESKNKGAEVTEAEQNSDHEIEGEEEQESASKYHSGHQLELNHPTEPSSVTDHDTKTKKNRSNQGHQPLAIAAQRLQPPAEPNASFDECQGNAYESKDGPNLQPGNDKSCLLYAQKQAIPAQEITECSPTNGDVDTGLETESGECEIGSQGCDEYSVPQEVHALLTGILPQEIYKAVCKAVDEKLSTYNFHENSFTKLSDKRLQSICNYIKKQTKLDVATHLIEIHDIIRLRFATFKAEKRPPVKRITKKIKRSLPPKIHPKIDFSKSHDHSHADAPLETGPLRSQDLTIKSQPPPEDISKCSPSSSEDFQLLTSSQPLNETPPPTNQRPISSSVPSSRLRPRRIAPTYIRPVSKSTVSEPKMFRLAAVGDVHGVGKLCSLHVGEDGKVEGTLVVDNDEISYGGDA